MDIYYIILMIKLIIFVKISILITNNFINQDNSNIFTYLNHKYLSLNFNISLINYTFSFKYNIIKVEYNIAFFTENNNLIKPSFLSLFYKLHILCQTKNIRNNINIKYLANIYQNKYFKCIEYFNINENMIFGLTIYKKNNYIEYFTNEFDPLFQINEFNILNSSYFLKRSFLNFPKFIF